MLEPDYSKWGQTLDDLFQASIHSEHPRTRERFAALFHLASTGGGATAYAEQIGRDRCTVMDWVHLYNQRGPNAMTYRRTGGTRPLFQKMKLPA